jgi:gliding motility-associated-like protein
MLPSNRALKFLSCLLLIFTIQQNAFCQTYIFAQLNGTPMNTAGWNLAGDAHVGNVLGTADSELIVCSRFKPSGAAFFNQAINLSFCHKWAAEFDFRMYDGTGADGLAFCFLDVPPTGYVTGGGLGIPDQANGLKVCFDTWNNCIPYDTATVHQDMPKIEIRWGTGYDNDSDPNDLIYGECVTGKGPTLDNSSGKLSYIRSPNYNHAKIAYDSGNISVYVDGTLYLTAYQPFNFTGYLGFTASTGGYNDNHSIKNAIIYTEMPPSVAGMAQAFCPHDTIQLGSPNNPAYVYSWNPPAGLSSTTVSAPLLHLQNNSDSLQSYTYYVKTQFTNNPGCASEDSVIVSLYPVPEVNFKMPEICLMDAVGQFYDSSYTLDPETLPFTYLWNFGDPHANGANPDNSTVQDPTHRYSEAAHYNMSLTVTDSKGCVDSASKIFTVNGDLPVASFTVSNENKLCSNQEVTLQNNSTVDFGSIVRIQIFWGDTATVSYIDSFPYPGKIYSHLYPDPVTADDTSYTIRMISFSGISCGNELDQQITLQPAPHAQFNAIAPVCENSAPAEITGASELSGLPGTVAYSGRGISSSGFFDPGQAGPGNDTLLYKFTATNGCADSAYRSLFVQAEPVVNAGNDTSVVIDQRLQFNARSSDTTVIIFLWTPPTDLSNATIANPAAVYDGSFDSVRYLVQATDSLGCIGENSILVKIFKTGPDIFMPNAFTPGKDINTIFRPIAVGISSLQFFRIYNRWGQLVYSTSRLESGWDGNLSGRPQDAGTYVWAVQGTTYTGITIYKKGTMTLIR